MTKRQRRIKLAILVAAKGRYYDNGTENGYCLRMKRKNGEAVNVYVERDKKGDVFLLVDPEHNYLQLCQPSLYSADERWHRERPDWIKPNTDMLRIAIDLEEALYDWMVK